MNLTGFAAPWWFLLLLVVAALAAGYLVTQRMRRKRTMRFANLELLDKVAPKSQGWIRHLPASLIILSLLLFTVALAGPTAEQKVPRNRATVVLVIDVSLSMESTDVAPSRIKAAQAAAKSFAQGLTPGVNLGLISFAGTATVLVAPTTERSGVVKAIDNLKLAQSTATGEGVFAALQSIESFSSVVGGVEGPPPARVVLMSDGKQNVGRDEFEVAAQAGAAHIPISTISFGTPYGTVDIQGEQAPVPVDDDSLARVAQLSGGEFYPAQSNQQIHQVYDTLDQQVGYQTVRKDVSRPWLILGTLICLAAAGAGLLTSQRLPA